MLCVFSPLSRFVARFAGLSRAVFARLAAFAFDLYFSVSLCLCGETYCVIVRTAGAFGRASALAMSQLA